MLGAMGGADSRCSYTFATIHGAIVVQLYVVGLGLKIRDSSNLVGEVPSSFLVGIRLEQEQVQTGNLCGDDDTPGAKLSNAVALTFQAMPRRETADRQASCGSRQSELTIPISSATDNLFKDADNMSSRSNRKQWLPNTDSTFSKIQ